MTASLLTLPLTAFAERLAARGKFVVVWGPAGRRYDDMAVIAAPSETAAIELVRKLAKGMGQRLGWSRPYDMAPRGYVS